jgi:hypothetical protein
LKTEPARTTVTFEDPPEGDVWCVPGDPHFGAQDDRAHEAFALVVESTPRCSTVISLGDTFDTWALSEHPKEANRLVEGGALLEEAEQAEPWMRRWKGKGRRVIMGPGNHEERWYRFAAANAGFRGLPWWHEHRWLVTGVGIETLPRGFRLVVGKVTFEHGHLLTGHRRGAPADSQGTVLKHYPAQNTVYGHVHRVGEKLKTTWKNGKAEYHSAASVGHLERPDMIEEYAPDAAMQQGGGIVRWGADGHFRFLPIYIYPAGKTGRRRRTMNPITGEEFLT